MPLSLLSQKLSEQVFVQVTAETGKNCGYTNWSKKSSSKDQSRQSSYLMSSIQQEQTFFISKSMC